MTKETKRNLGIVCAVCVVIIALGAIAAWQLYSIFTKTSVVVGAPDKVLEGGFELSEDEDVFFAYTIDALSFEIDDNAQYIQTIVFEPMKYNYADYIYSFFINGQAASSCSLVGSIVSNIDYLFYLPDGSEYNSMLKVELAFLNDRTELKLTVADRNLTGFLNQMTKSGLQIVVIAAAGQYEFEFAGNGDIDGIALDKNEIVF